MTRGTATLTALLALLPLLTACEAPVPSGATAGDHLPLMHFPPQRMRLPSPERPPWLNPPTPVERRIPVPDDGFVDHLG